jgi:hypothetical protein
MSEAMRIIEICAEINDEQPEVTLHNAFDPIEVELTLLECDLVVDQRLERYKGQVTSGALFNLGELLRKKLRKQVLDKVEELKAMTLAPTTDPELQAANDEMLAALKKAEEACEKVLVARRRVMDRLENQQ